MSHKLFWNEASVILERSEASFKKNLCLINIRPQDLLSHKPSLWFSLWFINCTIFLGHKVPQRTHQVLRKGCKISKFTS